MLKSIIKKFIPEPLIAVYHKAWAVAANIIYGFPSRKLVVIGVTGTKGKSTVSNMVWKVLTESGLKVGMTTTANFRINDKEWINDTKMTMQGRMRLQKLLRDMVRSGCTHAVVETSSEGIKQYRHWGIEYNVAVITNLTPEHIESHGSFENYRAAKGKLFRALGGKGVSIVNADDEHASFFQKFSAEKKMAYSIDNLSDVQATGVVDSEQGSVFTIGDTKFHIPLLGRFNAYNALAAIAVARNFDVEWDVIARALADFSYMPGRMEEIKSEKGFSIFVDYAHTVESLEAVYATLKPKARRLIAVLGSCGGGRDTAKRPVLGGLAAKYAAVVIVTNEDPYDEDPEVIIDAVWAGLEGFQGEKYKIIDRGEAIQKAVSLAESGDIIAVTGKGSEQCIVTNKGKRPWDDREEVRKALKS
ncbi:MAG: Mur ligase family protein [Patescibacteria group bacterium]